MRHDVSRVQIAGLIYAKYLLSNVCRKHVARSKDVESKFRNCSFTIEEQKRTVLYQLFNFRSDAAVREKGMITVL